VTKPRRCAGAVLVAACVVLATAPAAQAARHRSPPIWDIVRGSGSETVTFQGDGSQACQSSGRCADAGTVTYAFNVTDGSFLFIDKNDGFAFLMTNGATRAAISRAGVPCTDEVAHAFDELVVLNGNVLFHLGSELEGSVGDYIANRCGGPIEADVLGREAVLTGRLPSHAERRRTLHIAMSASRPFTAAGFTGTVDASVTFDLRRTRSAPAAPVPVLGPARTRRQGAPPDRGPRRR
jgi:hypothetical protein